MTRDRLHPLLAAAAREEALPPWARCAPDRRAHCVRVGRLMAEWAGALGLPARDVHRWKAAGVLHDALKDANPADLQRTLDEPWPAPVVHAPACAARLRAEGVSDRPVLEAIAYHPLGHPDLDAVGRFLILADYLDPGRDFRNDERAGLRERLPAEPDGVLVEVLERRITKQLARRRTLAEPTVDLWNDMVGA